MMNALKRCELERIGNESRPVKSLLHNPKPDADSEK